MKAFINEPLQASPCQTAHLTGHVGWFPRYCPRALRWTTTARKGADIERRKFYLVSVESWIALDYLLDTGAIGNHFRDKSTGIRVPR